MFKHRCTWLGTGLSLLCLSLVFWCIDPKQVIAASLVANWQLWPPAMAAYLTFMLLRAWRWRIMLGPCASFWPVFHAQSIGYLLTNIMPFRLGDVGRAYLISQQPCLNGWQALSTVVLERVLDMLVIVLLFALTLPFVPTLPPFISRASFLFGILAGLGFGLLLLATSQRLQLLRLSEWLLQRLSWLDIKKWLIRINAVLSGFESLTEWKSLLPVMGLSLAIWLAGVMTYYWGIRSFWPDVTWSASIFTLCVAAFGLSLPSSPSGVGVFHAAVWLALPIFSASEAQALGFAFVYHALTLVIVFILGGLGLWQSGQTLDQLLIATRRFVARRQVVEPTKS